MTQITKKKVILIAMIRKAEKIGGRVSLRVVRKPLLTAVMKQKRLGRRKHLLNDLEKKRDQIIFFSDENILTVVPVLNK